MMNMKRFLVAVSVVGLVAGLSVSAFAQCSPGQAIANVAGWQPNVTGVAGTTIITKFWQVGAMGAANSGTLASNTMIAPYSSGFYLGTDWGNTGVVGCPCPGGNCGTNRTAFLYSIANGGTAQYLIMSVGYLGGYFAFDAITNGPGNVPTPIAVPALTVASSTATATDITANLTWPAISAAGLKGYYDAAPANNIITGYAIRYIVVPSGNAPGTFATGSWTICPTGGTVNIGLAGTDPGAATVTFPKPAAGSSAYLALSMLFDSQTATVAGRGEAQGFGETNFMGAPTPYFLGPTAAALFTSNDISARQGVVTVGWTTNVETGVASFEVFYSAKKNGSYVPVTGASALPKGNNSSYSVTFDKPVKGQKLFYKVAAQMTDGSTQWSDVLKIVK